jgi:diaminopimelate decarboxylase
VTRAIHTKSIYREYVGLDASMADLMRPGLYGTYHHITVPGKEGVPATETYDVVGGLCENNNKFAVRRQLLRIAVGDYLVIHDGRAMGFNYNGKLRCGELLLWPDGEIFPIRRSETAEDYFATLNLPGRDSWEVFVEILEKCQVATTPGSGFGPAGQSFIRFSAFGHRADVEEACARLGRLKE